MRPLEIGSERLVRVDAADRAPRGFPVPCAPLKNGGGDFPAKHKASFVALARLLETVIAA